MCIKSLVSARVKLYAGAERTWKAFKKEKSRQTLLAFWKLTTTRATKSRRTTTTTWTSSLSKMEASNALPPAPRPRAYSASTVPAVCYCSHPRRRRHRRGLWLHRRAHCRRHDVQFGQLNKFIPVIQIFIKNRSIKHAAPPAACHCRRHWPLFA